MRTALKSVQTGVSYSTSDFCTDFFLLLFFTMDIGALRALTEVQNNHNFIS